MTPRNTPRHEVLVCTRNRAAELRTCLEHVARSRSLPGVLVVDSSDTAASREVVEAFAKGQPGMNVVYIHTHPGLTRQRNVALARASASVVHFIDDDSYVEPGYFEEILRVFDSAEPEVAGVGGFQTNGGDHKASRLKRLFFLSGEPGEVTRAAWNVELHTVPTRPVSVDWLSGCSMSFRLDVARTLRFDERMTGYSLGEDVEFCIRLRAAGYRLLVAPNARLWHDESPNNRLDWANYRSAQVALRLTLVKDHPDQFHTPALTWSLVGQTLSALARALRGSRAASDELRGLARGLLMVARSARPARAARTRNE